MRSPRSREEEKRHQKSRGGPILSLADHEEPGLYSHCEDCSAHGCPNLPAVHPRSLLLHPSSGRTGERLGDPVLVLPTLQTTNRCLTRNRVRSPKAVSGTIPLPLMWWLLTRMMMSHCPAVHARPRPRNQRSSSIWLHSRTP